jgi:membrane-associated phospholipid phosphatase
MKYLVLILCCMHVTLCAQNIDDRWISAANTYKSPGHDRLMSLASDSEPWISLTHISYTGARYLMDRTDDRRRRLHYVAGGYAGAALLTFGLKYTISRPRPYQDLSHIIRREKLDDNVSFPSGHTSSSFCTATTIALTYRKWYVTAPALLWAGTVSYSRMYRGMHYPTDLFAGAVIGSASAYVAYRIKRRFETKPKQAIMF